MINRAERRACGCGRPWNGHGCKVIASGEATNAWTNAGGRESAERRSKVEGPKGRRYKTALPAVLGKTHRTG